MKLIQQCVEHPVKVYVGMILLTMFGLISLGTMPIQLVPEVQFPKLSIITRWPGATPEEIENDIIKEQEEVLQTVEGVTKMTAECIDSQGKIDLEFPVGFNLDTAITLVNTRLQQVPSYPENVDQPIIQTSSPEENAIAWVVLTPQMPDEARFTEFAAQHADLANEINRIRRLGNAGLQLNQLTTLAAKEPRYGELIPPMQDLPKLRKFVEDVIETRFEKAEGVSSANVYGGEEIELQVIVDPEKLAARRITLLQLRDALRGKNFDISGGDFWEGKRRWIVRTLGRYRTPKQVEDSLILRDKDSPVYIRDVAEVKLGYKKASSLVQRFGHEVIAVNVIRRTGTNVLQVMDRLKAAIAELNAGILADRKLQLNQVYDETEYINDSVNLVWENIWQGGLLTVIVLLLFLRNLRSTVVVFISIAVSIIGMFLMMNLLGRTLNVPSLAGIAFAVGMLVDNFIVVLENAFRHRQLGERPWTAAVAGAAEVWGAVLTSTLANLAVFIPVLFVQDEAGQLFRDIALAAATALIMSLLVALLFVPTAAARILHTVKAGDTAPKRDYIGSGFLSAIDGAGNWFIALVVHTNAWLQRSAWRMLATAILFVVGSLLITWAIFPKVEYLPNGNRNLVFGIILPPPGYNLAKLREMGNKLEQTLSPRWNTDPDNVVGGEAKIGDMFYVASGRQLFLGLRAAEPLRAAELVDLVKPLNPQLEGGFIFAQQSSLFQRGITSGRTIDIEITGPDVRRLVQLGGRVIGQVSQLYDPKLGAQARPIPSLDLSAPEVSVLPKPDQAEDNGLPNNRDLGYIVDVLVDGAYTSDFFLEGDKIDLSVLGSVRHDELKTEDLGRQKLATPRGDLIDLETVADVRITSGPEQINRRERQRAITIQFSPPASVPLEAGIERIQAEIIAPLRAERQIGDGQYAINLGGTADKLNSAWRAMRWNLLLALIITYLVMAALFESWLYPLVIILSVPLGAVGGFCGLQLVSHLIAPQSLDVLTMLGFIILIGTVVNNPILIVEQALNLIDEGQPPRRAVLESVRTRIRPIFMTTFIGLFGLVPLVISPGAGSELYRGLGAVLLGGLVVSTLFTLYLVPCLFILALEGRAKLARLLGLSREQMSSEEITYTAAEPVVV